MSLSGAGKQRLKVLAIVAIVAVIVHIAYRLIHPDWVLFREAQNYYEEHKWGQAITFYEKSLAAGLPYPMAMKNLAESYTHVGNFQNAISWYEKYLIYKPEDLWARRSLAGALTAVGNFEHASKEYQKILEQESLQRGPQP